MKLLIRWFTAAAAVACAAWLVPGIVYEGGLGGLLAVAFILGLVNALVRPVLRWLSCGLIVLTLGLFLLVVNALMLLLVAKLAQEVGIDFAVDGVGAALLGSLVISFVTWSFTLLLGERR